ncbi:MAG: phosphatase PAP2 family protein [Planctomycetes bacterium]|nr:phosphatase PAP2 family protein [Planctomycetota bacterium]
MSRDDPPAGLWPLWRPLWRRRAALGGLAVGLGSIVTSLVVVGGGYLVVLRLAEARAVSIGDTRTVADTWFGPTPWAFWVYSTLYLYFPLAVWSAPRDDAGRAGLLANVQTQVGLALVSFAAFLAAPTYLFSRGEMEARLAGASGAWARAYETLYAIDAPYNGWPSLHVSLSLVLALTSRAFLRARGRRVLAELWWPAWIALLWSILATKQHHALDVWTGALLGAAAWRLYLAPRLAALRAQNP